MTLVDARGMRCPWPAIRAARAWREGARPVEVIADDPAASRELAALAEQVGAVFNHIGRDPDRLLLSDRQTSTPL